MERLGITGSYSTSFRCFDGSYALINGADLTLEYEYGLSVSEVRMTLSRLIFYSYVQLSDAQFSNLTSLITASE